MKVRHQNVSNLRHFSFNKLVIKIKAYHWHDASNFDDSGFGNCFYTD